MLTEVADGVLVHRSGFMQTNSVVVRGRNGALLVDPGITDEEMTCLADDLREAGLPVAVGFSTHPHWDHLLWHAAFGPAARFGTARCATVAHARLSDQGAAARVRSMMPGDIVERVPLDLLGGIAALPADASHVPWDGPSVRIAEHQAHAPGHAALLVEERGVLLAGDMLSDLLTPILDHRGADDPTGDYLAALELLETLARGVDVVVPGHGSVGGAKDVRARLDQDRAYVHAVRDGRPTNDPRFDPTAVTPRSS